MTLPRRARHWLPRPVFEGVPEWTALRAPSRRHVPVVCRGDP